MSKLKEYLVPMSGTIAGTAFVMAKSPEEAREKAEAGDHSYFENGETGNWEVEGRPEVNE